MAALILEPSVQADLIRRRRETGADRFDEVWDGVYVVSPNPNNQHQRLTLALGSIFYHAISLPGLGQVFPGVNITDQPESWESNYRIPDLAIFLVGNSAEDRGSHWFGGPDFAVEIISRGDRARDKLGFYSKVGVRGLLVIDREPWALELYRLSHGELLLSGKTSVDQPAELLSSVVLPLRFGFSFILGQTVPQIEVLHADGHQRWSI